MCKFVLWLYHVYCILKYVCLVFTARLTHSVPLQVKEQVQEQLKIMIAQYRDDSDLQNLIDWVQESWVNSGLCFSAKN